MNFLYFNFINSISLHPFTNNSFINNLKFNNRPQVVLTCGFAFYSQQSVKGSCL
jgi:hypothetical protein